MNDLATKLQAPFSENDVEWRIGKCGKGKDKGIWAMCLAYINARAVMDRLDEVVGPENWKDSYTHTEKGFLCTLSIRIGDQWVDKQDGAEETLFESFKGGISSAFKRAATKWGIGRYLYSLPEGWAQIVDKSTPGALYGSTKEHDVFYWLPPPLPTWALPEHEKPKETRPIANTSKNKAEQKPPITRVEATDEHIPPSSAQCADLRKAIREHKWSKQQVLNYVHEWIDMTADENFKAEDLNGGQLEKMLAKITGKPERTGTSA